MKPGEHFNFAGVFDNQDQDENEAFKDLIAALQSLGYPRHAAREATLKVVNANPESKELAQLIKLALREI